MSLSLNCLVLGDEPDKMFVVEVKETKYVSILKDLIKEKKAPHFDHVTASDLDLWMVDLCLDKLEAELIHVNLDTHSRLSARRKLSSFFNGNLDDELLHIIAKPFGMSH